jgi:hypothetical protein
MRLLWGCWLAMTMAALPAARALDDELACSATKAAAAAIQARWRARIEISPHSKFLTTINNMGGRGN